MCCSCTDTPHPKASFRYLLVSGMGVRWTKISDTVVDVASGTPCLTYLSKENTSAKKISPPPSLLYELGHCRTFFFPQQNGPVTPLRIIAYVLKTGGLIFFCPFTPVNRNTVQNKNQLAGFRSFPNTHWPLLFCSSEKW